MRPLDASKTLASARQRGPRGWVENHIARFLLLAQTEDELALGRRLDSLAPAPPPGHWLVLDGYLKKYPAVRHLHFGIELGARWHQERGPDTRKISKVRLKIYRESMTYCGNRAPRHAIQAQFSLNIKIGYNEDTDAAIAAIGSLTKEFIEDAEFRNAVIGSFDPG